MENDVSRSANQELTANNSIGEEVQRSGSDVSSQQETFDQQLSIDRIVSEGIILGSMGSTGYMVKQHYRFDNVYLSEDGNSLTYYYPPGFQLPPPQVVDTILNNASSRTLPTTTLMRDAIDGSYRTLDINYLPAKDHQPQCSRWIDTPTYVVQVQHNENIWHVWTDGVMGAFQTLREQGLLPLAQVDAYGGVTEYLEGLGDGCPWMINPETKLSKQMDSCREKTGIVTVDRCSPEENSWCREGVVSFNRSSGPILLLFKGTDIVEKWSHMYEAVSEDIRAWSDMGGVCFKELYLGKSNTLNFYMPLFFAGLESEALTYATHLRSNATNAFKALISTAERVKMEDEGRMRNAPAPWSGYEEEEMERLRQGIGPEEMEALEVLRPSQDEAAELAEMRPREVMQLRRLYKESRKAVEQLLVLRRNVGASVKKRNRNCTNNNNNSNNQELERPRPVVTYMWRDAMKRSVLNAHDILSYLLSRYNVTLRVTTFEEPLLETVDLLSHTDVLIGMHGAGWTNSMFIKRGAAAMQMLPYGWTRPDGSTIRGSSYKSIVLASDCKYMEWTNNRSDYAFIRRHDVSIARRVGMNITYSMHPKPEWPLPHDTRPGNFWINQNTFVDMESFTTVLDELMSQAGIAPNDAAQSESGLVSGAMLDESVDDQEE